MSIRKRNRTKPVTPAPAAQGEAAKPSPAPVAEPPQIAVPANWNGKILKEGDTPIIKGTGK